MDEARLREIYLALDRLDERLTHRLRPRPTATLSGASAARDAERLADVAEYAVELKELLRQLLEALGATPPPRERLGGAPIEPPAG